MSHVIALLGMPGQFELLIIGLIVLLLFGNRLPSVMASLGSSLRVFRKALTEEDSAESIDSA